MHRHAAAICARHELHVETVLCEEPDLAFEIKEALYRIAQEALYNIVKHAHAQHIALHLYENDKSIVLAVRDDGVGFNTACSFPEHLGLQSMRERTVRLGGSIDLTKCGWQRYQYSCQYPEGESTVKGTSLRVSPKRVMP